MNRDRMRDLTEELADLRYGSDSDASRSEKLELAEVMVLAGAQLVHEATVGTDNFERARAYVIGHLEPIANNEHAWLGGRGPTIRSLLEEAIGEEVPSLDEIDAATGEE